jgi:hypothetical protein
MWRTLKAIMGRFGKYDLGRSLLDSPMSFY